MSVFGIVFLAILVAWVALNAYVGVTKTPKQMRYNLISGQNIAGIIFCNIFYSLAWAIQLVKGLWRCRDEHGYGG